MSKLSKKTGVLMLTGILTFGSFGIVNANACPSPKHISHSFSHAHGFIKHSHLGHHHFNTYHPSVQQLSNHRISTSETQKVMEKQKRDLVGIWVEKGDDSTIMELTDSGKIIHNGRTVASYKVTAKGKVMIDNLDSREQDYGISFDVDGDNLTWSSQHFVRTSKKEIEQNNDKLSIENTKRDLVGIWKEKKNPSNIMELTDSGKVIHNGRTVASYKVTAEDKIIIDNLDSREQDYGVSFDVDGDNLTWASEHFVRTSKKEIEQNNDKLSIENTKRDLVGIWKEKKNPSNIMELTDSGKVIHNGRTVASYKVTAEDKIIIDNLDSREQDYGISFDVDGDNLTWASEHFVRTSKKEIEQNNDKLSIENTKRDLVGIWKEKKDPSNIMELTDSGKVIHNGRTVASYKVTAEDKIIIDNLDSREQDYGISFDVDGNNLTWASEHFVKSTKKHK